MNQFWCSTLIASISIALPSPVSATNPAKVRSAHRSLTTKKTTRIVTPASNDNLVSAQDALVIGRAKLSVATGKQEQAYTDLKDAQNKVEAARKNLDEVTARLKMEREKRNNDFRESRKKLGEKFTSINNEISLKLKQVNTWSSNAMDTINALGAQTKMARMDYDIESGRLRSEEDRAQQREFADHGDAADLHSLALFHRTQCEFKYLAASLRNIGCVLQINEASENIALASSRINSSTLKVILDKDMNVIEQIGQVHQQMQSCIQTFDDLMLRRQRVIDLQKNINQTELTNNVNTEVMQASSDNKRELAASINDIILSIDELVNIVERRTVAKLNIPSSEVNRQTLISSCAQNQARLANCKIDLLSAKSSFQTLLPKWNAQGIPK